MGEKFSRINFHILIVCMCGDRVSKREREKKRVCVLAYVLVRVCVIVCEREKEIVLKGMQSILFSRKFFFLKAIWEKNQIHIVCACVYVCVCLSVSVRVRRERERGRERMRERVRERVDWKKKKSARNEQKQRGIQAWISPVGFYHIKMLLLLPKSVRLITRKPIIFFSLRHFI